MKKILSLFLTLLLTVSMFGIPMIADADEQTASLSFTNVYSDMYVDSSEAFKIKGTLPVDFTEASLLIDDEKIADLSVGNTAFEITVSAEEMKKYSYGIHKVSINATVNGETETISENVLFTNYYESILYGNTLPEAGKASGKYDNGMDFVTTNSTTDTSANQWLYTNTDGTALTMKRQTTAGNYFRFILRKNNSVYPTSGKMVFNWVFSVSDPATYAEVFMYDNGSPSTCIRDKVLDYSKNQMTNTAYEANSDIDLTMIVNLDAKPVTRKYIVNGVEIDKGEDSDFTGIFSQVYVEFGYGCSVGSTVTLKKMSATHYNALPSISGTGYVDMFGKTLNDASETIEISAAASKLIVEFEDVVEVESAKIVTDGEETDVEVIIEGTKAYISLPEDLKIGQEYTAKLSGVKYGSNTYDGIVAQKFIPVAPKLKILSPENNAEITNENVLIKIFAPQMPEVKIDGVISDNVINNGDYMYTATLSPNLGKHKVEVISGNESNVVNFESVSWINNPTQYSRNNVNSDGKWMQVDKDVIGPDGVNDSAFTMIPAKYNSNADAEPFYNDIYFRYNAALYDEVIAFEADIKRNDEGAYMNLEVPMCNYDSEGKKVDGSGSYAWMGGIGSKFVIDSNGKIGASDKIFPVGEWHKLMVETNLTTKYVKVYLDGVVVSEGTDAFLVDRNGIEAVKVQIPADNKGKSFSFDNVKIGKYVTNPRLASVEYSKDGDVYVEADDAVVSQLSESVRITLDKAYDNLTAENVTVNGMVVEQLVYNKEAKTITIPTNNLEAEKTYVITVSDALTTGNTAISKKTDFVFTTNKEIADYIGDFSISADRKSLSIEISKAQENSILPDDVLLIYACYNGDELEEVVFLPINLLAGSEKTYSVDLKNSVSDTARVRGMLWKSLDNPVPLKK